MKKLSNLLALFALTACGENPVGNTAASDAVKTSATIDTKGAEGDKGEKGDGCTSFQTEDAVVIKCGDTEQKFAMPKDGAQGEQGARGEKGDKGDQGDKGDNGEIGADGTNGVAGAAGEDGESAIALRIMDSTNAFVGDVIDFGSSTKWLLHHHSAAGVPSMRFDLDRASANARSANTFIVYFASANCAGQAYAAASQVGWSNTNFDEANHRVHVAVGNSYDATLSWASSLSTSGMCTNTASSSNSRWFNIQSLTTPFEYPVHWPQITEIQ